MSRELPTAARLAGFGAVLAVAFGAAYAVGAAASPVETTPAPHEDAPAHGEGAARADASPPADPASPPDAAHAHEPGRAAADAASVGAALPGLAVSRDGYTLEPAVTTLEPGAAASYTFTVTGPDGSPVTAYETTHERDLHLVVVRRDLTAFQHLHPTLAADGRWTAAIDTSAPGVYRVFADFTPAGGEALTLGTDLLVPGEFLPEELPAPEVMAEVDGFTVALSGTPTPGGASTLEFRVSRNGAPVTELEPHLGAFGHLVALRAGDLAYLHTHPAEDAAAGATGGPTVEFAAEFPTPGTYRLNLEFRVDGEVRTAPFTVVVPRAGEPGAASAGAHPSSPHGH